MQESDKNLVWMHGYNVTPEYAEATFAEVFNVSSMPVTAAGLRGGMVRRSAGAHDLA
jgi:hypothetical protein